MKKINIPLIADSLLCAFSAFIVAFTLTRFYTKNSIISLIVALSISAALGLMSFLYIRHKFQKAYGISAKELEINKLKTHLCLIDKQGAKRLLGGIYPPTNEDLRYTLFYLFKFSPLKIDDCLQVFRNSSKNKLIYCISANEECKAALKSLGIYLLEIEEIYQTLKDKGLLPQAFISIKAPHISFVQRIKSRFNRRLSLPLFLSGISLLLLSYFTFFPIYYIAVGGILLALSIIAIIFK